MHTVTQRCWVQAPGETPPPHPHRGALSDGISVGSRAGGGGRRLQTRRLAPAKTSVLARERRRGGGSQETEANSLLNSRSRLWFPATRSLYFWMLQRAEHELHPASPPPLSNSPLLPPCPPVMSLRISLTSATNTEWDARSAPDCAPDRAEDTAAGWSGREGERDGGGGGALIL